MASAPGPVHLPASVRAALVSHARGEAPLECCGLLIGTAGAIEDAVPARNARRSATAFLIEPADHFAAIREARARGRQVVGAYHSHPQSPAVPSPADIAQALDPALLYVIVSLVPPAAEVRGYHIDAGRYVEVDLGAHG